MWWLYWESRNWGSRNWGSRNWGSRNWAFGLFFLHNNL